MVSPEKNKINPDAEFSVFLKNTNSRKKKKASSLLKSKKIYLYFKNHQTLSKYESQLKSYGAVIVPFLDKDISFVLTDVPGCNGKSSTVADHSSILSPICYSVSPATSVSGDDNVNKKSRTRAEAMLERVPTQSQSVTAVNPISNAISWKIPVYSVEVFQNWLAKKLSQIQLIADRSETSSDSNAKIFTKRYLKVESLVKNKYRPEFREVSRWPSIHLNTLAGSCPFDKKSSKKSAKRDRNHADKKKESDRMNRTCNKVTNESGYCEICAVHYKDLSQHVTESTHMKFVCNDKNYADLDSCMKTRSVDAFLAAHSSSAVNSQVKESDNIEEMGRNLRKSVSLHLNNNNENSAVTKALSNSKLLDESLKQPLQVQCNGFTNYHLRRTTIKSDGVCYDGRDLLRESRKMYASCPDGQLPNAKDLSQLSPLEDDSLHRLRSRRNLILPSILIGTTAEDASRHRSLSSSRNASSNHYLRSSVSPKGCSYVTRRKLPNHVNEEAATYRKVFNSSANHVSTTPIKDARHLFGSGSHFTRSKLNNLSPILDGGDRRHEPSLVSPGRPTKRKPSTTASDDEEQQNGAASPSAFAPGYPITKKFKIALCNNLSNHQLVDDGSTDRNHHRKRLSAEEKFLEDNKAYYKVEMLRTKLRSTESYCSQVLCAPRRDESRAEALAEGSNAAGSTKMANETNESRIHKLSKRNSALQLLNLEAEKFMFGSPKNDQDDSETDEDGEADDDRTKGRMAEESRALGNDSEEDDEQESKTNGFAKQNGRRAKGKKRRTHAELFIHDNLDYYKFEISGSRLRHHGDNSGSGSVKSETNSCSSFEGNTATTSTGVTRIKDEVLTDDESEVVLPGMLRGRRGRGGKKRDVNGDSIQHRVSHTVTSPAHQSTFASPREELSNDHAHSADASSYFAPSLPPPEAICFSFESVPSKEPWYRAFQRYDSCDEQHLHIPRTVYFSRYRDIRPVSGGRREKQSVAFASNVKEASSSTTNNSLLAQHLRRKGRQKMIGGRIIIDDRPRKSPRCHASTLAILSSLTSHRRRSRKLHVVETKKSSPASAPRHSNRVAPAEVHTKAVAAELSQEHQQRLFEAFGALAKDADEHFIEVFSRDDCEDRYLRGSSGGSTPSTRATKQSESSGHDWRTCLLVDESILLDDETLKCFADGSLFSGDGGTMGEDMGAFMESAQRCTSMESAAEEEWSGVARQQHDTLSRLCRENEFSCNSSDCGASSTCEFLGFSEDGRSVSRKRKRKRPNMTGWPKRRHMRFLERRRMVGELAGCARATSNAVTASEPSPRTKAVSASSAATTATSEAALSEADSECSEDDVPLVQIVNRKKRRTNSTTASSEECSAKEEKSNTRATASRGRKFTLKRRKCKNSSPSKTSPRVATRGLAASPRRRGRRLPLSRRKR